MYSKNSSSPKHDNRGWKNKNTWSEDKFLAEMVRNGLDNDFIEKAKQFGEYLVREANLNTTQIRRIFGQVKKIESLQDPKKFLPLLLMLRPLMEYTVSRNSQVRDLKNVLEEAITAVYEAKDDPEKALQRFRLFCKGFEAIIAYHRGAGGK